MTTVDRNYFYEIEKTSLAPYAAFSSKSKGRQFNETQHPYRTEFQRDRERIIHSRAFRRLEYKTQVFINHEGDHYRTRLTHSIEVAQIARTIARVLRLNEDLSESIALAHDLGHTPFGHAGERELNLLLKDKGGFEHNRQSLRVVDELEKKYKNFDGLNLTWETREGIIKHSSPYDSPEASSFANKEQPSLEAQIIDLADEIAYNNHDLDDGIESKLLDIEEIETLTIWDYVKKEIKTPVKLSKKDVVNEVIRGIINLLVTDLINYTNSNIIKNKIKSYEDIRTCKTKIVGLNKEINEANKELKKFLHDRLYKHFKVSRMTMKAQMVIRTLFFVYTENPETIPWSFRDLIEKYGVHRAATDYIAGMTDRYALEEHRKLTDPSVKA